MTRREEAAKVSYMDTSLNLILPQENGPAESTMNHEEAGFIH
jgi:hypothetical protein